MSFVYQGPLRCFLNGHELKGVTAVTIDANFAENSKDPAYFVNLNLPVKTIRINLGVVELNTEEL